MHDLLARFGGLRRVFASVFRNRDLARVQVAFAAFGIAEFGTWVAILVYAYERGGAAEMGFAAVIQLVPAALLAPFASVLGDRYRRDRVLAFGYLVQALTMVGAGAAIMLGAGPFLVYPLAAVVATAITLTRPVQSALLPQLARTPEELTAANAAAGTIESGAGLVGPGIAGVLLGLGGPGLVFAALGGGVLIAALLQFRLTPQPEVERSPGRPFHEAIEGFRAVAKQADHRVLVGLMTGRSVISGALDVMVVVIALGLLQIGQSGAGYLTAAVGAGGLIGGLATFALIGRRRLTPALGSGLLLLGIPVAVLGLAPGAVIAAALLLASGSGYTVADVSGRTLLQRVIPDDVLTRVFGVLEGLDMAALAIGSAVASALTELLGPGPALAIVGALLPVVALLMWRRLRAIDLEAPVPVREIALLREIRLFAPLDPPSLESVAGSMVPVEAALGENVITQGHEGDRFYVIEDGRVEVARDGQWVATLGPGDYFGEIALLRDVPRTASVTALGPVRLFALERADFLEAVTGHPVSREAADAVVEDRLR